MKWLEALVAAGTDETWSVKCSGNSKGVPSTIRVIFGAVHCDPMLSRNAWEGRSHPDCASVTLEQKQPAGAQSNVSLLDGCRRGSHLLHDSFEQRRAARFCRCAVYGDLDGRIEVHRHWSKRRLDQLNRLCYRHEIGSVAIS